MILHLRDVTLVRPGEGPDEEPSSLTIEGGRLRAVGASEPSGENVRVIDLEGRFATPGLVNAHDHLYSHELRMPLPGWGLPEMRRWLGARDESATFTVMLRAALEQMAQGITTIRDLGANHGANTAVARAFTPHGLLGPHIDAAGRPIVMTGGHVWTFGREADGPWEVRQAVREQIKAGATVIKIMASGGLSNYPQEDFGLPQFSDEELDAIVDEARRQGAPTCAHAFGAEAVHRAVVSGVDSIEHGIEIADDTLALMRQQGTVYVPTLANMRRIASMGFNRNAGTPEQAEVLSRCVVEPHGKTFRRVRDAGIPVAVGTDSTGTYEEELEAMIELGMSFDEVLTAATVNGADLCRQPVGRFELGQRADLAIHSELPTQTGELLAPDLVCRAGRIHSTAEVRRWVGDQRVDAPTAHHRGLDPARADTAPHTSAHHAALGEQR